MGADANAIELGAVSSLAFAGAIVTVSDGANGVLPGTGAEGLVDFQGSPVANPATSFDLAGTIMTGGDEASGIWADGVATIVQSGAIATAGERAHGIGGDGTDFDITVTGTGTIDTTLAIAGTLGGLGPEGLAASLQAGDDTVVVLPTAVIDAVIDGLIDGLIDMGADGRDRLVFDGG
ncbi:MAG: hypothetical protein AAFZ09_20420, partial [Pseudomonadota bacterium]